MTILNTLLHRSNETELLSKVRVDNLGRKNRIEIENRKRYRLKFQSKTILAGNIETKSEATDTISRNVALRNELDLFVNVLECRSYAGVPAHHHDINIAIVRQNTEGEYAMLEHEVSSAHLNLSLPV